MRILKIICLTALMIGFFNSVSYNQTKLAQTGFNFLDVSSDARSSAMGDAVNSLSGYSGALSFNTASMADIPGLANASFSLNNWIADIKYLSASVMVSPFSGDYGVVGVNFQSVDYGTIEGTVFDRGGSGYIETGDQSPTAFAIGIGYAKMLNDKFSIGGQVKYASVSYGQSLIPTANGTITKDNKANAVAFDFGTLYKTGVKSLAFGMSVRNFSKEVKFEEEGFQLPLIFSIGISANVFDFVEMPGPAAQSLIVSVDATHPRSHPEQVKIGAEYSFMKILSLRGGYISGNDENSFTYGLGISSYGVEVDYAYTPFGVFDNVQRFTARISL